MNQKKGKIVSLRKWLVAVGLILTFGIQELAVGQTADVRSAQSGRFDLGEIGAKGNGNTLDTQAIQTAIRSANQT